MPIRIIAKGQITIPAGVRRQLGLKPHTKVSLEVEEDALFIRRADSAHRTRGQRLVERICGTATVKMTTDEIMALTRGED